MIKKLFRQMTVTQIISSMTVTICMLIDSIMIARFLGVESMSAYGFANPLLLVFAALGSMISAGIQVVCGKAMGNGDREGTDGCFTVSVTMSAAISLVGLVLVFSLANPLVTLLGAGRPGPDNPVFGLTKDYILGFILGAPAFLSAQIMVPYMQLSGRRTRLVLAVAAMTVSDIVFDLLNVFVFHGGTFGMGLASSLSYYIAFAIGGEYFLRPGCLFRFRRRLVRRKTARDLVSYGIPTVVNQISMVFLVLLLNRMLLSLGGNVAVAAYSVISTVGNLCYCFGAGVGSVAMMLGAIFYTDEDRSSIRELVRVMTRGAILQNLVVTGVVLAGANLLVALFFDGSPEATRIAVFGLRLFVLSMVPSSLNSAFKNYYQGVNRIRLSELISFLQNFVMPVSFAFLLSRFLGLTGLWLGFVFGESATLLVLSCIVWRHHGSLSLSADAYSMLERDFGAAPDDYKEWEISSLDEAMAVSREAERFCEDHGLEAKISRMIGLCIEEMTVNIITHGFTKDKVEHNVDLRLILREDKRLIRIRDNCVNFDPTKYLELHHSDDPLSNLGLRVVMGLVKEANYVNSLGLNNLNLIF